MPSWKQIVQDYIIKHSDKIKKTTRPLKDHLGVSYFTYHRIDLDGKYTVFVDRPDWAEHYVQNQFYLLDPYLRHPDVYKSGIVNIEANGSEEYLDKLIGSGRKFHLDIGVLLIEKGEDYVEFFGCSGARPTCNIDTLSMNTPQILKSFADHFRREMAPEIEQMGKEASSLIDLKGADYFTKEPISPLIPSKALIAYLRDLGMGREIDLFFKLSHRERECLQLLHGGKSAKETAAALKLSSRTIEAYLENMKNKLGCYSKHEMFALAARFHDLGLLP